MKPLFYIIPGIKNNKIPPENHYKDKVVCLFLLLLFLFSSDVICSQVPGTGNFSYSNVNKRNEDDDTLEVRLLYDRAVAAARSGIHDHTENGTEFRNAVYYYLEGLKLSLELNYENGVQLFYQTLSEIYNQKTDLPVIGYEELNDTFPGNRFRDFQYYRNKKHFGSLDAYIRAAQTLRELNADEQVYLLDYWIGLIYFDWFNYPRALKHFEAAFKNDNIKSDSLLLSDVYQCAGASFYYKGSYDSAIICINNSLEIPAAMKDPLKHGIALSNLGEIYYRKSDFSTALTCFRNSHDQFVLSGDSACISLSLAEVGKTGIALNQYGEAEDALLRAMKIAGNLDDKAILGKTYYYLDKLFMKMGDYEKAYYYLNEFSHVKESLQAESISGFFSEYQTNWQNEMGREITKKEGEALKRSETTVELNKTRLYLLLLGLIIIIVFFAATYTYRLYRLKRRANIYLTELNRSKEKFLSIISHDVRGPIVGFIDLLEPLNRQIKDLSPGQISGHLDKIISMSQNIKLLVDNLLEWTKAQQGLIECKPEPFSLYEAVAPDLEIYRQIAGSKGIRLVNNLKPETGIVADRNMIRIIVRNLLNNAVKFSGKGDAITINAFGDGDHIVVSVEDTGIGIEPDLAEALFDEGSDVNTMASGRRNSGLGLLLCREYVEKCNGKIWVKSDGANNGSAFFFTVKTSQGSWIKSN